MNGAAAAASTSPANPLPPMPSTTTFSTRSWLGQVLHAPGREHRRLDLLGEAGRGPPHVEGVDGERGRGRGGRSASGCVHDPAVSPVVRAPPASALAMRRACSASSTAVASSISMTGMPSRTA